MNCCASVGTRAGGPIAYMPYAPVAPIAAVDRDPWDMPAAGEAPPALMPYDVQPQDFAVDPDYGAGGFEQPARAAASAGELRQFTGSSLPYPTGPYGDLGQPDAAASYDSSPAVMLEPQMRAAAQQLVAAFDRDGDGKLALDSEAPPELATIFGSSATPGKNVTSLELARTLSAYGAARSR